VLVVGAGIAGMQAALEVADSGHHVYLVERAPTVGGRMMQLDKTFPTLDCASCIGTPKMSMVGSNPNIDLLMNSEIVGLSGSAGDFKATVKRRATYVIAKKCTACDECTKVCPVSLPSEWQMGMGERKATFRPFAQAVPNKFTIDKRGLPPCRVTCPAEVNAQGYVALISQGRHTEALEVLRRTMPFAGVCGRVCTHPCEGECERGKVDEPIAIRSLKRFMADYELQNGRDKAEPVEITQEGKVAVVGSGPSGIACAYDLVRLGYAVTVFEAAPKAGGLLRYGIPEYRLPDNIVDDEIAYVQELGVEIRTGTPVTSLDDTFNDGYKAIYLAVGASVGQKMGIPGEDAEGVHDALSFLHAANSGESVSIGAKVAVVGGGNAAIDAARMAQRVGAKEVAIVYRRSRAEMPADDVEIKEAENEGIQLNILANPVKVLESGGKVSGIECIRMELGEPDESGRRRPVPVDGSEFTVDVDTVIMAIGQRVNKDGLPDTLDYTGWGTISVDEVTFGTNVDGVFAGGDVVSGPATVIEAVAAGKEAAISIHRYLQGADLTEGRPKPRERVKDVDRSRAVKQPRKVMPTLETAERIGAAEVEVGFSEEDAVAEALRCLNCGVCSECMACVAACEPEAIDHEMRDEYIDLDVGAVIVATGYDLFDPTPLTQYGYGRFDNVITSMELERMIASTGPTEGHVQLKDGSVPKSAAIIHCVGSRDENYHEYCSRVCCMYSLKHAHLIKEKAGGAADIYQMYIDMRCYGKGYEEFYRRVSDEGINFIRGKVAQVTDITQEDEEKGKLIVVCEDTLLGNIIRVPVDMVILAVAIEPRADADDVASLFWLNRSTDGFFEEKHYKLDPLATATDGIYMAGCCQGPKDIPDTVAQAIGAAAKALALVTRGEIGAEAVADGAVAASAVADGSG
jgi:heterodisulfide reductase subunit A